MGGVSVFFGVWAGQVWRSGFGSLESFLEGEMGAWQGEREQEAERFRSLPMVTEQWLRLAATVLSRTVETASLVTPPIAETNRFKHLELIAIQGRLVLMVLVLHGGSVHQRMLNLAEPVPQETLSQAASHINVICDDLTANEVRMKAVQMSVLEREVSDLASELIERADDNQVRVVYREGLSEIINRFEDSEGAQQAVRVFEERAFLNMILAEVLNPIIDGVQVVIAGEGRWNEISRLSIILSRYGIPGQASGAIGVLGPTHINYGRAISTVSYLSGVMTDMLVNLYQGPGNGNDSPNPNLLKGEQ